MNTILNGRCALQQVYCIGMRDIFPGAAPNVIVSYTYSGLGFAGRIGGPVPTVTVELTGLNCPFFFSGGLMGFDDIVIPTMRTTITGEDLSSSAPS